MRKYFLFAFALWVLGAGRVGAQSASYSFDKSANFQNYKTYKWVSIPGAQQLDELTADQLMGTLDTELAKKGLKPSQSDKADLYIGYQIARGKLKQLTSSNAGLSYEGETGGSSGTGEAATTVHSGQLVLDMYDAGTKKLVWRGAVAHSIDADAKPATKQKHMDSAIQKLLKNYPPK